MEKKAEALKLRGEGVSQSEIAALLGVNQSTVSRWCAGINHHASRRLDEETVCKIREMYWQGETVTEIMQSVTLPMSRDGVYKVLISKTYQKIGDNHDL